MEFCKYLVRQVVWNLPQVMTLYHSMIRILSLLSIGALLLLGGCSTLTVSEQPEISPAATGWALRKQQLSAIQEWRVEGRAAFRVGREGGQSGFVWEHTPASRQFSLSGLLGLGSLVLEDGGSGARLTTDSGEIREGRSPEQLLQQTTGWSFPVREAGYWIRGIPAPMGAPESMVLDTQNRLHYLNQSGWSLEIRRYQQVGEIELPAMVVMEQGEIRVKMVLSRWGMGDG